MTTRETLKSSWPLRALLVALLIRLVGGLLGPGLRSLPLMGLLDVAANLVLVATLGYFLFILLVRLQRRLPLAGPATADSVVCLHRLDSGGAGYRLFPAGRDADLAVGRIVPGQVEP